MRPATGTLPSRSRQVHDGAFDAGHLFDLRDVAADIGDHARAIEQHGEEGVVDVVALENLALFAAGDDIFRLVMASLGERHEIVFDFGIEAAAEEREPAAAVVTRLGGHERSRAERFNLCHSTTRQARGGS